ncbi:AAA family ATPase [Conexibacter sp. CPCC 206217]|uniref:AAA family ATPase n=1 Tax=Conexibacter sp. CPCC 206217 TaxID=3064574 RepID=UPI0027216A06|nr:AAA family ATPase [Conexibacter sp. CPCC 206217]MDO8210966.1 AAA family ATPase [Conexibacter sp. CPCC 206217]
MRLDRLYIGEFKNLRDLQIDFDERSPYTVIVGENGAGKSNLLEALTLIFRQLDLGRPAPFDYRLSYRCRDHDIKVEASAEAYPRVHARAKGAGDYRRLSRKEFAREDANGPLYRPAFVFGYYSGPTDRLAAFFERHRERYYDHIITAPEMRRPAADPNSLRRLFYAETLHGQFALLAFFMNSDDDDGGERAFLREKLQIDGLDSVLFALKRPPWGGARRDGDSRFWEAVGEVQTFLDRVYDAALMPSRMSRRIAVDLAKNPAVESLYLFLRDAAALERVYHHYDGPYAFFTALESTHLSKLLGEVRTRVRMTPAAGGGEVTYRDLSEGEQQLLLVLGLLKFTARSEALFLLDEPDTHLNPAWSTQYLDFLDRFMVDRDSCHILLTTHDPLVFAQLTRPQVRIFRRSGEGTAVVEEPLNDPRGMGIQAILASDLFRLPSGGLDRATLRDIERQRSLALKDSLTEEERNELRAVTDRLNTRAFWKQDRDPLYQLFMEQFMPRFAAAGGPVETETSQVSFEDIRRREELADVVAEEIAREFALEPPAL